MGGSIITATDKLKYLEVSIDDKITWIPHITYVKNNVSKGIGIMFKDINYLKRNALVNSVPFLHIPLFDILYRKHGVILQLLS